MLRGLYTAASGLTANQRRNDVVANNLANVNTTGFKKEETVAKAFNEVLLEKINYANVQGSRTPIGYLGKGVSIDQIITDHQEGTLKSTEGQLDVAIVGSGFLTVQDEDGSRFYTRDGSLTINSQGQLANHSGHLVLGSNGPIEISGTQIVITKGGQVVVDGKEIDTLSVVDINNPRKHGNSLFTGQNAAPSQSTLQQGFLETSNVNAVGEMVKMINLMRAYETSQRVVQAYDNSLEKLNEIARF